MISYDTSRAWHDRAMRPESSPRKLQLMLLNVVNADGELNGRAMAGWVSEVTMFTINPVILREQNVLDMFKKLPH